jgi:TonB family protein
MAFWRNGPKGSDEPPVGRWRLLLSWLFVICVGYLQLIESQSITENDPVLRALASAEKPTEAGFRETAGPPARERRIIQSDENDPCLRNAAAPAERELTYELPSRWGQKFIRDALRLQSGYLIMVCVDQSHKITKIFQTDIDRPVAFQKVGASRPQSAGPGPVRAGDTIQAPKKVTDVSPIYPPVAQSARVQGIVIVEATIGVDGHVEDVRVLQSIPLLDEAAIEAVKQWEYTPTLVDGMPVRVIMTVTVNFTLS